MADTLLVMTTVPDADCAHALANALVEAGLAACVNILAPCRSVYRWQGAVDSAHELPLMIKTTAARYAALEAAILSSPPLRTSRDHPGPCGAGLASLSRLGRG